MSEEREIPNGWVETTIDSFADVLMGQSPPSDTYNNESIGLPFFQGKAEFTELHPVVRKWCAASNKVALPNDILISVRAPVGATNIANLKCCIGRGLSAIRYTHCNKFLFYFLRLIEKKLDEKGTGTTFRAISGDIIKKTQISLPPLAEQHRIVAKIEELFSSLDKGIESLKTAQEQLKVYRQAVLKWAFEGKFTSLNCDLYDSYDKEDLETERKQNQCNHTNHKNQGSDNLPEGWKIERLGNFASYQKGKKPKNVSNEKSKQCNIPYVNIKAFEKNIIDEYTDGVGCVFCEDGDFLMVWDGSRSGYIGKAIKGALGSTLVKINFPGGIVLNYAYYFLLSKYLQINTKAKGTGIPHVDPDLLWNYRFPIAPLAEQHQIVSEIEKRLSVCDKIEEIISASLLQAEALRQSILKKAFEGRLVPQDPDDEPAEKLLERIKAERAKNKLLVAKKKSRKSKKLKQD